MIFESMKKEVETKDAWRETLHGHRATIVLEMEARDDARDVRQGELVGTIRLRAEGADGFAMERAFGIRSIGYDGFCEWRKDRHTGENGADGISFTDADGVKYKRMLSDKYREWKEELYDAIGNGTTRRKLEKMGLSARR